MALSRYCLLAASIFDPAKLSTEEKLILSYGHEEISADFYGNDAVVEYERTK